MTDSSYSIEFAKSNRSKCKKCKTPIPKDEMRLGVSTTRADDDYQMTSYFHVACFTLPRKLSTGPGKMSVDDFVDTLLQDSTSGDILPAKREEIVTAIAAKPPKGGPSGAKEGEEDGGGLMDTLKAMEKAQEAEGATAAAVVESDSKKRKRPDDDTTLETCLEVYLALKRKKVDELKDPLRWNRQILTGTKDYILVKVIDGEVRGRLTRCHVCGGRLKLLEDGKSVACSGTFDEDTMQRIPCSFTTTADQAPRGEWFKAPPTEEEQDQLDLEEFKLTGKENKRMKERGGAGTTSGASSTAQDALVQAASDLAWSLGSRDGMRQAAQDLVQLLQNSPKSALNLPDDPTQARQRVGQILAANKKSLATAADAIPLLIQEFGLKEATTKRKANKAQAMEESCVVPANVPVVLALQELADLYFQEGNRNAGTSYVKAVVALAALEYQVTTQNAKQLAKGKTKVAGIGAGTAAKVYEFLDTGTMEKLEEKRALNA